MNKKIRDLLSRARANFRIDLKFIFIKRLELYEKIKYLSNKYLAILKNARKINYLGRNFYYDNRYVPAILQGYPNEIFILDKSVDLSKIKTVLDIGANIGQFAFTLNRLFPKIEIYCIEPNKKIFEILKKNVSSLTKIKIFNFALGEKGGKRMLYYSSDASAEGSFFRENLSQNYVRDNIQSIQVDVIRPSSSKLHRLGIPAKFDLVKIDVEGSEMEVLKSLADLDFKYLFIEVSIKRRGAKLGEIIRLIENEWKKKTRLIYREFPNKESPAINVVLKLIDK